MSHSGDWPFRNEILRRIKVGDHGLNLRHARRIMDVGSVLFGLDFPLQIFRHPTHYAYSTYARSVIVRRDNLRRSANELKAELQRIRLAWPKEPQTILTSSAA